MATSGFLLLSYRNGLLLDGRRTYPWLIYSGFYCGSKRTRSRAARTLQKARRDRSINFTSPLEPYIFSLSSRFARHVLLKYDNFTRGPGPPSPDIMLSFLFRFHSSAHTVSTDSRFSSAFVYNLTVTDSSFSLFLYAYCFLPISFRHL